VVNNEHLLGESASYTLTLTTTFTNTVPVVPSLRDESNTGEDFAKYVTGLVTSGVLVRDDYFIVDNAPTHSDADMLEYIMDFLAVAGIRLVFLPKYSPERNPCELVFNVVKKFVRENREDSPGQDLWAIIVCALATITFWMLYQFYGHAIRLHDAMTQQAVKKWNPTK